MKLLSFLAILCLTYNPLFSQKQAANGEGLHVEAMPRYNTVMENDSIVSYYVFLEGMPAQKNQPDRIPLHLALVIDKSGSMNGEKIVQAKEAMKTVASMLSKDDLISIVSYGSDKEVVLEAIAATDTATINQAIDLIEVGGGTNLSSGLEEGYAILKRQKDKIVSGKKHPYFLKRVLLLSDGNANAGITDPTQLRDIAGKAFSENAFSLSTFGVGVGFNENLMTSLTKYGGGNYYFIESENKLTKMFEEELNQMFSVCAREAKVEVSYPQDQLEFNQVYLYPAQEANGKITVQVNDIFTKQQKAIIFEFKKKEQAIGTYNFSSEINFLDARKDNKAEQRTFAHTVTTTTDKKAKKASLNDFADMGLALQFSGSHYEKAMDLASKGEKDAAKKELEIALNVMDEHFKRVGTQHPFLKEVYKSMLDYRKDLKKMKKAGGRRFNAFQKGAKCSAYKSINLPKF
jgi:Ca-activated chloride channel family protein